jgi:hypothetical protein
MQRCENGGKVGNQTRNLQNDIAFIDAAHAIARRPSASLLVERLGVGGGGSDVGIARSLVGAGLLLEVLGSGQVGLASSLVGSLVSTGGGDEVSDGSVEGGEHCPFVVITLLLVQ